MDLLLAVGSRRRNNPIIQQTISNAVNNLPILRRGDVDPEEVCAICLNTFDIIFQEEGQCARDQEDLGPGDSGSEGEEGFILGLTKVEHCGHMFCRRDLAEWIRGFHGSCPTCRHPFLELPAESEDESSDGEYIPDEEDDQDYFDFDLTDYSEVDALVPSEAEIMEMNEIAQAREDAEAEVEAALREGTATEILFEEGSDEDGLPLFEEEDDSHSEVLTETEEPIPTTHSLDWLVEAEVAALESREGPFDEERIQQEVQIEAEVENEIMQQLWDVAEMDEELEEDFTSAVDYMGDESDSEFEDEVSALVSAPDTVMDVVFSDSSSDSDYEPADYVMSSDSEPSDSGYTSSDFDYGVDDLAYLDQADDVAIHGEPSSDGPFILGTVGAEKAPPRTDSAGYHTSERTSR